MATDGLITMSQEEILRLKILEKLEARELRQNEAGKLLHISCRQVRRLLKNYKRQGVESLVSKKRGKPSNNKICRDIRGNVVKIIREKYIDFGPTFLGEKLLENHGIDLCNSAHS